MKKILPLFLIFSLLLGCQGPDATTPTANTEPITAPTAPVLSTTDLPVQLGLNFIRFFWEDEPNDIPLQSKDKAIHTLNFITDYVQPAAIFADFAALGSNSYRQLQKADPLWPSVEPQKGQWDFTATDAVILYSPIPPMLTLFQTQYSSPTPPWVHDSADFQKTVGADAKEYVETVVKRYAPYVKYWEIGNEMEHWMAADPGVEIPDSLKAQVQMPSLIPTDGFSPEEQGKFFAEVSEIIRANDPDAVILMPGMGSIDDRVLDNWLNGVIAGGGTDWFDIVNYHYYGDWNKLGTQRDAFTARLKTLGLEDKPVWMTETGSTSSSTLTMRTDYPNDESTQAADVFRRIVTAWGHGDSAAFWHTYIGSTGETNDWRDYGIKGSSNEIKPSYYAFQLLAQNCTPFTAVEIVTESSMEGITPFPSDTKVTDSGSTQHIYKITTAAGVRYVAWGSGSWTVPSGLTQSTSVVPSSDGTYTWQNPATALTLTDTPILLK